MDMNKDKAKKNTTLTRDELYSERAIYTLLYGIALFLLVMVIRNFSTNYYVYDFNILGLISTALTVITILTGVCFAGTLFLSIKKKNSSAVFSFGLISAWFALAFVSFLSVKLLHSYMAAMIFIPAAIVLFFILVTYKFEFMLLFGLEIVGGVALYYFTKDIDGAGISDTTAVRETLRLVSNRSILMAAFFYALLITVLLAGILLSRKDAKIKMLNKEIKLYKSKWEMLFVILLAVLTAGLIFVKVFFNLGLLYVLVIFAVYAIINAIYYTVRLAASEK